MFAKIGDLTLLSSEKSYPLANSNFYRNPLWRLRIPQLFHRHTDQQRKVHYVQLELFSLIVFLPVT